ncbi:MFS transporter [Aestuariivirga litoralis]|uniref:MFS transporter n=1 Tax=Aestuariivirga litoralis TaxID=2650924 RepID=A0A2W2AKT4_9HYPH|nr:MFS transporter [Aestuariivirga litoralis]PZF75971.1 MFS transporter [Aestuariivirga litoralis]
MLPKNLPRGIWMLGFVSLFMDVSSEMIHAILPLFVVGTLGASAALLGLLEGLAEATAQISKLFSGVLSDRWGSRKGLALLGYGLAAVVKPLFPLATSVESVFAARFIDRVGKGIRGAPRDALVADIAPPQLRGAAFGLRQSLDTVGAFAGPLIAILLMSVLMFDLRSVMWVACVPALIAVALLAFGVEEAPHREQGEKKPGFDLRTASSLGRAFWEVTAVGAMMMLARFSEAFLVLKASATGLSNAWVPMVMVVMSLVYSLASYPAGALSDRVGRRGLLVAGLLVLIVADLVLAFGHSIISMIIGVALWGLHMGLTQGGLSTMVADTAPKALRGTAFGLFNLASGLALLVGSVLAGVLWDVSGPAATFLAGAGFAILTLLGLSWVKPRQPQHEQG